MKRRLSPAGVRCWLVLLAGLVLTFTAQAATYLLPQGDVVGQIQYTTASGKESLAEIARRYDIGIDAITAANPHLDHGRPAAGARILIPSRHILPPGPREGVVINMAEMLLYYYLPEAVPQRVPVTSPVAAPAAAPKTTPAATPAATPASAAPTSAPASATPITLVGPPSGPISPIKPIVPIAPLVAQGGAAKARAAAAAKTPVAAPEGVVAAPEVVPQVRPEEVLVVGPALVSIYPIGLGREGRSMRLGSYKVEQRLSRPSWTVPEAVKAGQPRLPDVVPPGPKNPLGAYAITLDSDGHMIHGTNAPGAIGTKGGNGGVAMYPEDIELFIHRVATGTPVRIVNEMVKHGYKNGALYLEFRKPEAASGELNLAALVNWMSTITTAPLDFSDWQRVQRVAEGAHGIAMPVVQVKGRSRPGRGWWLQLNSYKTAQAARALINKIEAMEVPLAIKGCYDKHPCTVVAGPFDDKLYIEELRKKIKWVAGVKGTLVPYQEEDDFQLPPL